MKRVGLVGWRGMVGSVLMDRMQAEGDFAHFEPVFFSTSNVGGSGPKVGGKETGKLLDAKSVEALKKDRDRRHLPGRRLHERGLSAAPRRRLEGLLDRCGQCAADEGRRGHHSRSGQLARDRGRAGQGGEGLCRRQLHGQPDADGPARPVSSWPGGMDDQHDLPGRQRGWGPEHARAAEANGRRQRQRDANSSPIPLPRFSKSTAASPRRSAARPIPPSISASRSPAA